MTPTHAYLSGLVTFYARNEFEVLVKAHTWSASSGWLGDRRIGRFTDVHFPVSRGNLEFIKGVIRDASMALASDVDEGTLIAFGSLCLTLSTVHGEFFPTWIGDHHIMGLKRPRGCTWTSRFLITEAPGLDCGHWEGDPLPETER